MKSLPKYGIIRIKVGDSMVKISASLLSARDNLEKTIEEINNLDIDYIHLDIMDGKFVPNTSFTHEEIKTIVSSINNMRMKKS